MSKKDQSLFELDRRMELKLRLAAKKSRERNPETVALAERGSPDRDLLDRLIERIRDL